MDLSARSIEHRRDNAILKLKDFDVLKDLFAVFFDKEHVIAEARDEPAFGQLRVHEVHLELEHQIFVEHPAPWRNFQVHQRTHATAKQAQQQNGSDERQQTDAACP